MSDFEFIVAMIILFLSVVFVIAGTIFLLKKRAQRNQTVYITYSGKCYHTDISCPVIGGEPYAEMGMIQAKKQGYGPCSKCRRGL